jgi:hypothetical protein
LSEHLWNQLNEVLQGDDALDPPMLLQSDASSPIDLSDSLSPPATEEMPLSEENSLNSIDPKLSTIGPAKPATLEKDTGDDTEKVPLGKKLKKNRTKRQVAAANDETLEELTVILQEKLEKDDERMKKDEERMKKEEQRFEREEERSRKEDLAREVEREAAVVRDEKLLNLLNRLVGALAGSSTTS